MAERPPETAGPPDEPASTAGGSAEGSSDTELSDKAGVVVFSRILSTLIDLATIVVLVRLLSKDAIAVIGFLLLVYQTARSFATFGFPESVFYFFEKLTPADRRAFALQTALILAGLGLVAGVVLLGLAALAPYVLRNWSPENLGLVADLLPWLALISVVEIPTWPMNNVLLALDRQRSAAWYQIVTSTAGFAALVGPVVLGFGIEAAVYGLAIYAVARLVVTAIWFQIVLPGPAVRLPAGAVREQVGFSVPLGLNSLSTRLNKYVDKFVVSMLLPAAAFADYQVGGQEIPLITAIPYAVGSVFISRYARLQLAGQRDELISLWLRGIEGVALIVLPVAALFIAVAHDFITLVFGAEYASAVAPFQIYTVILFHRVTQYGAMLQAFADTRSILRFTLFILACNCALSVPFTLLFHIPGTALATLLAAALGWYLYLRRIGHHLALGLRAVFPWRFYLKTLGVAGVAGVTAWALRTGALAALPQVAALAVSVGVFAAVYAALGTATRVIGRRHWATLWGWLRLRFLWRA